MLSKRDHRTRLAPTLNFDHFRDETKRNLSCDDDKFTNTFIFYFSPAYISNASNVSSLNFHRLNHQFFVYLLSLVAVAVNSLVISITELTVLSNSITDSVSKP